MHLVLEGGKADRIPVALVTDSDYQCQAAGCDHREFRHGTNQERAEIQRRFWLRHQDNDCLLCWSGLSRRRARQHKLTREGNGYFLTDATTGEKSEVEAWQTAANPHRGPSSSGNATPITCEQDIPTVMGPRPTAQQLLDAGVCDTLEALTDTLGDRAFLAFPAHGVFPGTVDYLGGFERAMEAVVAQPRLVAAVVEEIAWRCVARIQAAATFGPDAIWQSAYLEGADLISPAAWRELVLPGHRIMVREAKRLGLKVLFWFLGDCMPLLEDIVQLGVDALVVEQPRRGYSSDPGEIRRVVGQRLCVYGWSPELPMINGDKAAIARAVESQIRAAGLDGGFVMGSTYLTNEVACETVDYFASEVARLSREIAG